MGKTKWKYQRINVVLPQGADGIEIREKLEAAAYSRRGRSLSEYLVEAGLMFAAVESEEREEQAKRMGQAISRLRMPEHQLCRYGPAVIARRNRSGICRRCQREGPGACKLIERKTE